MAVQHDGFWELVDWGWSLHQIADYYGVTYRTAWGWLRIPRVIHRNQTAPPAGIRICDLPELYSTIDWTKVGTP